MIDVWPDARTLGQVHVLTGRENGKYPHGNSLLVQGRDTTVLVDPSMTIHDRWPIDLDADRIMLSHCHEDHMVAVARFPERPVAAHELDVKGMRSMEGLLSIYGLDPVTNEVMAREVVEHYHWAPRPDATSFTGGDVVDVGASRITVVHTPGHTSGHCAFLIEPEGVLFLGDIDLTGFGPYYADASSSLDEFEATLDVCRQIEAAWYVTYHHKGVMTDRATYLDMLEAFAAVIPRRDDAIVEFCAEPRSLDEMVERRFLYRPHVELPWVSSAETRTITQHLDRLVAAGRITRPAPHLYQAA